MPSRPGFETDYLKPEGPPAAPPQSEAMERQSRQALLVALRLRGFTPTKMRQHLAECLNPPVQMTEEQIAQALTRYFENHLQRVAENTEQLRALENHRYDSLWAVWYPQAIGMRLQDDGTVIQDPEGPNQKAAEMCLKISARRAKINGLDAPKVHEHRGSIQHLHQIGVDPKEVERSHQAFLDTFQRPGLPEPQVIDLEPVDAEP